MSVIWQQKTHGVLRRQQQANRVIARLLLGVVVVVTVSVVHGEEAKILAVELPPTPAANGAVDGQGAFPVVLASRSLPGLLHVANRVGSGLGRTRVARGAGSHPPGHTR